MTIKDEKEPFVARWSRLKQEGKKQPAEKASARDSDKRAHPTLAPKSAPPELPPLDKVTFDSDFKQFFHPKVDEDVRRAALKKLFSDPRFNLMDGLDVHIEDYSKADPIPAAMLAGMQTAQQIIEWAKGDQRKQREPEAPGARAAGETPAPGEPPPASASDPGSPATERASADLDQKDASPEPSRRKV